MDAPSADETMRGPVSATLRTAGLVVVSLVTLAQLVRAYVAVDDLGTWLWYAGLAGAYLILFTLVLLRPPERDPGRHVLLAIQCLIVLALLALDSELDYMTALFVPLAFLAAMSFSGRTPWCWVAVLAVLTAGSLMLFLGPLRGLSLAMVSVAVEIVFAAFVVAAGEIESARRQSQVTLEELEATHGRLQAYAAQAGELAAADERDRVARDLNDSVAKRISGILEATAAAREVVAADPCTESAGARAGDAAPRLAALQAQTQQALAEMRGLIAELRPKAG